MVYAIRPAIVSVESCKFFGLRQFLHSLFYLICAGMNCKEAIGQLVLAIGKVTSRKRLVVSVTV